MKRFLLTTLLTTVLSCAQANASMVIVDYQGETFVTQNSIERNLIMNSDDGSTYNVAIRPLDDALRSDDGRFEIPLQNLFINNTREDVYLRYNEYSNLFYNITMGGVAQNMTAKIRDYGMVPAGTYNMNFEIQATDVDSNTIATMTTFNLQFIVPTIQEVSLFGEIPKITITASDALNKAKKVATETNPMIYINSNSDWILCVNADNFGDSCGNYYIRTVASSDNVSERLQERVLIEPGKEIIIAKGKAPANNQYVSVEVSVESKDGKFIPAGDYENNLRLILREERG